MTLIDFTLISNPLGQSNRARHAMRKSLKTLARRPDVEAESLTRFLCNAQKVPAQQVLLGHGSSQLLSLVLHTLKPKSMLVPSPCPRAYGELLQARGVEVHPFELERGKGFQLDVQAFEEAWTRAASALVASPHNPTGAVLPEETLARLVETSERSSRLLIIDGGLAEFAGTPRNASLACRSAYALYLGTFSSYHALAGLRLGYVIGQEPLLKKLSTIMGPCPPNSVALTAALASLRDKGYRKRTSACIAEEKAYVLKKLQGRPQIEPFETPWGFLMRVHRAIEDLQQRFYERGILVEAYTDRQGDQHLSFPLRSHPHNARFLRALFRILHEHHTI